MVQMMNAAQFVEKREQDVLKAWIKYQLAAVTLRSDLIKEVELQEQSREFLKLFVEALKQDGDNIEAAPWKPVKELLSSLSRNRALKGFSPSETATFVFSLKQPIFDFMRDGFDTQEFTKEVWPLTILLDKLGLYTTEIYQKSRDGIISR